MEKNTYAKHEYSQKAVDLYFDILELIKEGYSAKETIIEKFKIELFKRHFKNCRDRLSFGNIAKIIGDNLDEIEKENKEFFSDEENIIYLKLLCLLYKNKDKDDEDLFRLIKRIKPDSCQTDLLLVSIKKIISDPLFEEALKDTTMWSNQEIKLYNETKQYGKSIKQNADDEKSIACLNGILKYFSQNNPADIIRNNKDSKFNEQILYHISLFALSFAYIKKHGSLTDQELNKLKDIFEQKEFSKILKRINK